VTELSPLFSSTIKVDCPDGPRYILKHPEKAFAIAFPEWNGKINFLVKFLSGTEARMDPEIHKRTKSIVEKLTENYAALQAHYQAAYLGWWGNPCNKDAEKAYNDARALICEKEFALKEIEPYTLKIAKKVKSELPKSVEKKAPAAKKAPAKKKGNVGREVPYPKRPSYPKETHEGFGRARVFVPKADLDKIEELVSKLKV
jgi:hypothetical protein